MSWIVLTDGDNDPVLFNVDDISCILVSIVIPNGSTIWFKNQENGELDVKESLAEIYAQISSPHSIRELLDQYDRKEPIMQEVPKTKPKITRWEKWAKSVDPENYKEIICYRCGSCNDCVLGGKAFSCKDDIAVKAYLLEEVEDE